VADDGLANDADVDVDEVERDADVDADAKASDVNGRGWGGTPKAWCFLAVVVTLALLLTEGTNAVQVHWSSCSIKHKERMAVIAVRRDNILIVIVVSSSCSDS
jgi:hypothetical protein